MYNTDLQKLYTFCSLNKEFSRLSTSTAAETHNTVQHKLAQNIFFFYTDLVGKSLGGGVANTTAMRDTH